MGLITFHKGEKGSSRWRIWRSHGGGQGRDSFHRGNESSTLPPVKIGMFLFFSVAFVNIILGGAMLVSLLPRSSETYSPTIKGLYPNTGAQGYAVWALSGGSVFVSCNASANIESSNPDFGPLHCEEGPLCSELSDMLDTFRTVFLVNGLVMVCFFPVTCMLFVPWVPHVCEGKKGIHCCSFWNVLLTLVLAFPISCITVCGLIINRSTCLDQVPGNDGDVEGGLAIAIVQLLLTLIGIIAGWISLCRSRLDSSLSVDNQRASTKLDKYQGSHINCPVDLELDSSLYGANPSGDPVSRSWFMRKVDRQSMRVYRRSDKQWIEVEWAAKHRHALELLLSPFQPADMGNRQHSGGAVAIQQQQICFQFTHRLTAFNRADKEDLGAAGAHKATLNWYGEGPHYVLLWPSQTLVQYSKDEGSIKKTSAGALYSLFQTKKAIAAASREPIGLAIPPSPPPSDEPFRVEGPEETQQPVTEEP